MRDVMFILNEWGSELISFPSYWALLALSFCYALILQVLRPLYDPKWMWAVVMGGVILVGCLARWRLAGELPAFDARNLAVWSWRVLVYHFCMAAIAIVGWQIWQDRHDRKSARAYRKEKP